MGKGGQDMSEQNRKTELTSQGERRVEKQGSETAARGRWWRSTGSPQHTEAVPMRCWERSAFWVSVVMGLVMLVAVVVGVGGFCRQIRRNEAAGGPVGGFCGAACRVCYAIGFSDWRDPFLPGLWGDDVTASTDTDTEALSTNDQTETASENEMETDTLLETELATEFETEIDTEEQTETEVETEGETETETAATVGDRPVVPKDLSDSERGGLYMEDYAGLSPDVEAVLANAEGWLAGKTVLIVSSHPRDAYRDGGSVSGLAETLADLLRAQGVQAVYVPVSASADSYVDSYREVVDILRYETAIEQNIGLIIDLRRSSELTEGGGVLQTDGCFAEARCAQIRLTVDGGGRHWQYSLGAALQIREALWNMDGSLARPTRLDNGKGMTEAVARPAAVMTVEIGSFGNRYVEAERVVPLLAQAVASVCLEPK